MSMIPELRKVCVEAQLAGVGLNLDELVRQLQWDGMFLQPVSLFYSIRHFLVRNSSREPDCFTIMFSDNCQLRIAKSDFLKIYNDNKGSYETIHLELLKRFYLQHSIAYGLDVVICRLSDRQMQTLEPEWQNMFDAVR